ncbi:hypothetical protein HN385_05525 [archaeon]|jgi:hypothetical protein|nr:hypothetical protein [archaeon]MBT3450540.1 hypothetical protein [archaeon]MBT6868512.1 hypothetical protein [archaeon]MBT7193046.1 hypothetical protein [archaeon]MBT7381135.1 hypothetical protein [archaeon]
MPERRLIIDQQKFSYEGLFNPAEVYNIISTFFFDKGWDWYERNNQEMITPSGKQIKILVEPYKKYTNYYKAVVRIKLIFTDLQEVSVEQDGQELRLSQGLIKIMFDGYIVSDYKGQWADKPLYWFFVIVRDLYFFKNQHKQAEVWLTGDVEELYHKLKTYLNTFNYRLKR